MKAWDYTKQDFTYAQKNLRLLSGLYGLLRPLDLIQPHRLEMGTVYANPAGKDLYAFWGDRLCNTLNRELKASGSRFLINLASQEYFKSTQPKNLEGEIVSPIFKDEKNGKFKIIQVKKVKASQIGKEDSPWIIRVLKDVIYSIIYIKKSHIVWKFEAIKDHK